MNKEYRVTVGLMPAVHPEMEDNMGTNIFDPKSNMHSIIRSRFKLVKLPQHIKLSIQEDILKWYDTMGPQTTLDRLKFLKDCIKGYAADPEGFIIPSGGSYPWVAKRYNSKRLLKGNWGNLQLLASQGPSKMKEVGKIFQCFSAFSREITDKDIIDWKEMVEAPYNGQDLTKVFDLISSHKEDLLYFLPEHLKSDIKYQTTDYNFTPEYKEHHENGLKDQLSQVFNDLMQRNIWGMKYFDFFKPFIYCNFRDPYAPYKPDFSQGEINLVKDPGMKMRFVLNHYKPLEYMAAPLGKRLYDIIKVLPWDSTFNENQGFQLIQKAIKQGKTCYSLDMKNATDRFPFEVQLHLLKELNLGPVWLNHVDLISELYRLPAYLKVDGKSYGQAHWSVGQPMGAYPSFALFSFTHGALLFALCGGKYTGQFVVHGDDLVIMDKDLADKYLQILEYMDVECNIFKSVISKQFAEMNSKLIYSNHIVEMRKWRPVHKSNILDHIDYWGVGILDLVYPTSTSNQNKNIRNKSEKDFIINRILPIPGVLPGYKSLNPKGLSLEQRLELVPDSWFDKKPRCAKFGSISKSTLENRVNSLESYDYHQMDVILAKLELNHRQRSFEQKLLTDFAGENDISSLLAKNFHPSLGFDNLSARCEIISRKGFQYSTGLPSLKVNTFVKQRAPRLNHLIRDLKDFDAQRERV